MTRLDRVIKAFNDYDKLIQDISTWLNEAEAIVATHRVNKIRDEVSMLVGELNRYGCRRQIDVIRKTDTSKKM